MVDARFRPSHGSTGTDLIGSAPLRLVSLSESAEKDTHPLSDRVSVIWLISVGNKI